MVLRARRQSEPEQPSDGALVVAAQQGDIRAQEALVRRYGLMVNRLAYRLLGSRDDVDDLVQDAFLQALRSLKTLKAPESFRAWLSEIVVRTAHNVIRRRRLMSRLGLRRPPVTNLDELISPAAPLEVVFTLKSVYQNIQRLPAKVRIALVLRRVDGHQLDEVAGLMGASVASVKRWLAEADRVLSGERRAPQVQS